MKQSRKWLEARSDQHSLIKAWSNNIVDCCLNKVDQTREKNPSLYKTFIGNRLAPLKLEKVQYLFSTVKVAASGQPSNATDVTVKSSRLKIA